MGKQKVSFEQKRDAAVKEAKKESQRQAEAKARQEKAQRLEEEKREKKNRDLFFFNTISVKLDQLIRKDKQIQKIEGSVKTDVDLSPIQKTLLRIADYLKQKATPQPVVVENTPSVMVANPVELDENFYALFYEVLVKYSKGQNKNLEEQIDKLIEALKKYRGGGAVAIGGGSGLTKANVTSIISLLTAIDENTDGLELKADTVNLNTDEIEGLIEGAITAIENISFDTTGLATEAKQDTAEAVLDDIKSNTDNIPSDPSTEAKQDDIITKLTDPSGINGAPVTVGTAAVELTFTGTTRIISIIADHDNAGAIWWGPSNIDNTGANAYGRLAAGQAVEIGLNDGSAAIYVVSDTAAQKVYKVALT